MSCHSLALCGNPVQLTVWATTNRYQLTRKLLPPDACAELVAIRHCTQPNCRCVLTAPRATPM